MLPLQCVWQHHVAKTHLSTHMLTKHDNNHAAIALQSATRDSRNAQNYAHMSNHSLQVTEEQPICARSQPHPPHTRGTYHRRLQETTQGFVLRLSPQSKAHATLMQPLRLAASRGKDASLYAHGNKTRQQSCSHCTAICNQRFKKRKEVLRTHGQPLFAEHRGGTDSRSSRSQPHPPHTRDTFHRGLQPL